MKLIVYIFLLILSCASVSTAQQQDSLGQSSTPKEIKHSKNTFLTVFRGNPGKAALYSLVLPGSGQLYNGHWWKVPIVLGAEGGLFAYAYWNTSKYNEFKTGYQQMLDGEIISYRGLTDASQVRLFRDRYQRQKDFAWVYFAISHLLNVVDAFVSRHLQEFDISEDLGIQFIIPDYHNPYVPAYTSFGIGISLDR